MKAITRILASAAFLTGIFAACSDLSDLEQRVDSLESRVAALETVLPALYSNIEALQALTAGGTINSATQKDGVWTIVLSNGETLTLTQGSIGVGNAPVMSVDKDGYWMVNYGNGAEYLMFGDKKVMAVGTDGITPKFGVDASGFWTVSYDGGKTFQQVKGADGNPVSALPTGDVKDPYFSDIKLENDILTITMRDGEVITVPVISDFLCAIEAEGLQLFGDGETKPYNVSIKGVKSTMITVPTGWKAVLSDPVDGKATLTVTAPVTVKSTLADSGADVCILAFSEQNFAAITKIQVQLSDAPVVVTPIANVAAGEATETSLTFNVATANTTSWKYTLLKDGETAPEASAIASTGTEGNGTSVTIDNLESATAYVLYVVPVNGEILGTVASCKHTTATPPAPVVTDLYQAYLDGQEIEIAGVKYSKAANGDPILLEATEANTDIRSKLHQKTGVFFLDAAEGASFTTAASIVEIKGGEIILVGRHTDKEVVLKPEKFFKMSTGGIALKNITLDMIMLDNADGNDGYFLNNSGTEDLTKVHFDGCKVINIQKNVYTSSTNGCAYAVKSFNIVNNVFELIVSTNVQMFNFYNCKVMDKIKEVVFDNNIVCNKATNAVCQIFNWGQSTAQSGTVWEANVSFCNNTLYNTPSANGHFKFYQVGTLKMNNNLLWADSSNTNATAMLILYSTAQTGTGLEAKGNIAYGLADGKNWVIAHSNSTFKFEEGNTINKQAEDPLETVDFATYTFKPKAEFASCGAQR